MPEIAEKIKKLLDKANGTTNAHEAAAFMAKATAMMAEHNLDMDAVDLSSIKEAEVKSKFSVSKPKDYEMTLMHSIAASFGCSLMWRAGWGYGLDSYAAVIFVGPKDRLQLATYAAEVLGRQLARARADYSTEMSDKYWQIAADSAGYESVEQCKAYEMGHGNQVKTLIRDRVTKEANSFAMGWAMEIRKKVAKFALNDREQALLEQYTDRASGVDEDGKPRVAESEATKLSAASMMLGQAAAKDAHLHRPMGDQSEAVNVLGETRKLS